MTVAKPRPPSAASSSDGYRRRPQSGGSATASCGLTTAASSSAGGSRSATPSLSTRSAAGQPSAAVGLAQSRSAAAFVEARKQFARRLEEALARTKLAAAARIVQFIVSVRRRRAIAAAAEATRDNNVRAAINAYRSSCRRLKLRKMLALYHLRMLRSPKKYAAAVLIQQNWRRFAAFRRYKKLLSTDRERRAALVRIEAEFFASVKIQALWRGAISRIRSVLPHVRARRRLDTALVIQRWWRQQIVLRLARLVQHEVKFSEDAASRKIQNFVKRRLAIRRRIVAQFVVSMRSKGAGEAKTV